MRKIGEDVAEVLDYVPARFCVIRHVRPKLGCTACERIAQIEAPSRPIDRSLAGPGLLVHVLVSNYADQLRSTRSHISDFRVEFGGQPQLQKCNRNVSAPSLVGSYHGITVSVLTGDPNIYLMKQEELSC